MIEGFLTNVCVQGGWFQPTIRTLSWLLHYLAQQGVSMPTTVPPPPSMQEKLLDCYRRYLADERGITEQAAEIYTRTARRFVAEHCSGGEPALEHVTTADVTSFMTRHCRSRGVGSAKLLATGLRPS